MCWRCWGGSHRHLTVAWHHGWRSRSGRCHAVLHGNILARHHTWHRLAWHGLTRHSLSLHWHYLPLHCSGLHHAWSQHLAWLRLIHHRLWCDWHRLGWHAYGLLRGSLHFRGRVVHITAQDYLRFMKNCPNRIILSKTIKLKVLMSIHSTLQLPLTLIDFLSRGNFINTFIY